MNCFIQKTRKMLILICLILTLTSLQNLRIAFCTLQMLTNTFLCSYLRSYALQIQRTKCFSRNTKEILAEEFFMKLKEIEKSTMLDHSIFGFFDRCQLINYILCEYGYFLRFYERRNKFRY